MDKSKAEQALDEYFETTWKSERPTCIATLEKLRQEQPLTRLALDYAWGMTMLYVHPRAKEIAAALGGDETEASRAWGKRYGAQNMERLAHQILRVLEGIEFPEVP